MQPAALSTQQEMELIVRPSQLSMLRQRASGLVSLGGRGARGNRGVRERSCSCRWLRPGRGAEGYARTVMRPQQRRAAASDEPRSPGDRGAPPHPACTCMVPSTRVRRLSLTDCGRRPLRAGAPPAGAPEATQRRRRLSPCATRVGASAPRPYCCAMSAGLRCGTCGPRCAAFWPLVAKRGHCARVTSTLRGFMPPASD